jgi:hypothetical protein
MSCRFKTAGGTFMDQREPDALPPQGRSALSRKSRLAPVSIAVLVILGLGAAWLWRRPARVPLERGPASIPDGGPAPGPAIPGPAVDLAVGEALMRKRLEGLSTSPEWTRWLGEKNLLARVVAAVDLVASGESPRPVLSFLAPSGSFTVEGDGGALHASAAGFARYDTLRQAVTGLDPAKLAAVYVELAPVLRAAFKEIAPPSASFGSRLHAAIAKLTSTPISEGLPLLVDGDHGYVYADPALEALSPAQKHLLRMGPTNARALVSWLAALERALPAE